MKMASVLLSRYCEESHILGKGVEVVMNRHSGNVFLTDSYYHVAMLNGDKLEIFHTCFNCGKEGFAEEFGGNDDGGTLTCPNCHQEIY